MGQNLLVNGSFDDGHYNKDGVPELAIPNGWGFWYMPKGAPLVSRQDSDWFPPETVVWNIKDAPENERDVFFLSGAYCLKVFKGWGPIWWRLAQAVFGLVSGARYRFSVPIHPDLVMAMSGAQKIYANDMLAGEHILSVKSGSSVFETGWQDGERVPFGKYTVLQLEFVAAGGGAEVAVEVRGRWGLLNNGWFLDALSLERIGDASEPEPFPAPAPDPVPPVSDTGARKFWVGYAVVDVSDGQIGELDLKARLDAALAEALGALTGEDS